MSEMSELANGRQISGRWNIITVNDAGCFNIPDKLLCVNLLLAAAQRHLHTKEKDHSTPSPSSS